MRGLGPQRPTRLGTVVVSDGDAQGIRAFSADHQGLPFHFSSVISPWVQPSCLTPCPSTPLPPEPPPPPGALRSTGDGVETFLGLRARPLPLPSAPGPTSRLLLWAWGPTPSGFFLDLPARPFRTSPMSEIRPLPAPLLSLGLSPLQNEVRPKIHTPGVLHWAPAFGLPLNLKNRQNVVLFPGSTLDRPSPPSHTHTDGIPHKM